MRAPSGAAARIASRAARAGDLDLPAEMNAGLLRDEKNRNPMDLAALRQFYIREAWRRRGLGRAAMHHLMAKRGGPGMPCRLEVLETNPAGRAFWQALGFAPYATVMERTPR